MPGYYPGRTEQQHGGILVALAHVHCVRIEMYLRNRHMLTYQPNNTNRTVRIDHVAKDLNYPTQLNHFQTHKTHLNLLPIEPIWEIIDYIESYQDGRNLILAMPSLLPFSGLFVKPTRHGGLCQLQNGRFSSWHLQRGYTALMTCIERRDSARLASLLAIQPSLPNDTPVSWGVAFVTPLQLAISWYSSELIKLLLVHGARIEGALDWALSRFSIENYRQILPLLGLNNRMELIFDAISAGRIGYLRQQDQILLKSHHNSIEPLLFAIMNGQIEISELLLERGISLSTQEWTLFTAAAYSGHVNILRALEERELRSTESKKLLTKQKTDKSTASSRFTHHRHSLTNHHDARGYTLVTAAAAGGQPQVLEYLREAGYDPFVPDPNGRTGESIARELGHINVLEWYAHVRNETSREQ